MTTVKLRGTQRERIARKEVVPQYCPGYEKKLRSED